jgi:2-amino-4-hydroxy-6-hydroxymethyldihydropteridine diphosphokinase
VEQHVLALVGLGSNAGDARKAMERAVAALAALPDVALAGVSRLYRTRPVGPLRQGDFLNAVVGLRVPSGRTPEQGALALLVALKALERALGRVPRERWGPREIDLDLLLFGAAAVRVERPPEVRPPDAGADGTRWLEVPHPEAAGRLFVLAPLAELVPELEPPGWGLSVEAARRRALGVEGPEAVAPIAAWDEVASRWHDTSTSEQEG